MMKRIISGFLAIIMLLSECFMIRINADDYLSEQEMKKIVSDSSEYILSGWDYNDFDEDGDYEAFASFEQFNNFYELRFIDSNGNITVVRDKPIYSAGLKDFKYDNKHFVCLDSQLAQRWRDCTFVYSVRNDKPYELDISGQINWLNISENGELYTYEYEMYNSQVDFAAVARPVYYDNLTQQFSLEPYDNSQNRILSEIELNYKLDKSSSYQLMGGWIYRDFDGNGTKEGFAAFSEYNVNSLNSSGLDYISEIRYIDCYGNITTVSNHKSASLLQTPIITVDGKTFVCYDTGTGAGYFSQIFGVKNGNPYELKISQKTESLIQGDDGEVYTYRGIGPYGDEKIRLIYDKNTQEFSKPEIYYFTIYQNEDEPVTLYRYTGYAEEIVIPEKNLEGATITKISEGEFTEYSGIKSIVVPKTIESIGDKSIGYFHDYFTGESGKIGSLVIKGHKGSAAEKYAKKNGFKFIAIDANSVGNDTDNSNHNSQNTNYQMTESDKEMISEVSKYCSDKDNEFRDRINDILNSNTGWEIKQNELLKVLSLYGINDIQEGMTYLRNSNKNTKDSVPYVLNYNFLVNDKAYCSSNYYEWLMSSDGAAARASLSASSLIFNHEILDVAFGDLFTDDPIASNPNAKKNKKMLIDFLSEFNTDFGDALKDHSDLVEFLDTAQDQIKDNKDAEKYIKEMKNLGKELSLNLPHLSKYIPKYIENGSAPIKFAGATVNDIKILVNMDEQAAIYERNRRFLETIRDSKNVSADMRRAAISLLDDITNGFDKTIRHILGNACQLGVEINFDMWTVALKELGITNAESYLATYSIGVFVTNALTGINKFTEEVAYSLGYAELSKLYSQKLKSDREKFLEDQSKDRAWQFFEDYTILWCLRYSGEEQYLKSQTTEGLFSTIGTKVQFILSKKSTVDETLSRLEDAKFDVSKTITIPESVQYMKKAIIHCPVDVYVYKGDELIATFKDGTESDTTNSYGRFAVVYNPCTDEYEKVICQSTNDDLDLKIIAVDTGIVDAEIAHLDSSDNIKIRSFDNEPITKKDTIELSTDITNNNYTIDKSGDGKIDATKSLTELSSTYTPVTNITCSNNSIDLVVGNNMALDYSISPDNATYKSVRFVSDDPDIVDVDAGKIIAKSVGTTTIYIISSDNNNINSEITVSVTEKNNSIITKSVSKPMIIGGIIVVVIIGGGIIFFLRRKKKKP